MHPDWIRAILMLLCLIGLGCLLRSPRINVRRAWAIFFSFLYVLVMLPIVDELCVRSALWSYVNDVNEDFMPADVYFMWAVIWGIIPVLFLNKYSIFLFLISFFWVDLLVVPQMELAGILILNTHWIWGELILLFMVFVPAYVWAYAFYYNKWLVLRACFQVVITGVGFLVLLPVYLNRIELINLDPFMWSLGPLLLLLLLSIPGIAATIELVTRGKGTPFPFDPTERLVLSGPYAYCRNPIQISFTLIFMPLCIQHQSFFFLLGALVSIAYSLSIANPHERVDMTKRYGKEYSDYSQNTPIWFYSYKPKSLQAATLYYSEKSMLLSKVFGSRAKLKDGQLSLISMVMDGSSDRAILKYSDDKVNSYGVCALAHAMQHFNVIWAFVGWILWIPCIVLSGIRCGWSRLKLGIPLRSQAK